MPAESVKHKVVALVRKYSRQMDNCSARLDAIEVAQANLETALKAAEEYGCSELASAVMAQELIESSGGRGVIISCLKDPMGYVSEARTRIENFKHYL